MFNKNYSLGTSLVVQWLRLHASNAGTVGSIPGQGTKIPYAVWHGQKIKKKKSLSKGKFCSSSFPLLNRDLDIQDIVNAFNNDLHRRIMF